MYDYQPPKDLLRDRTILVTGAGDGIGRVAAQHFAAHGATVVLLGRTLSKLEEVYDAIEEAGGPQPGILPMNLESATEQEFENLGSVLEEEFGTLEGILHNAAELKLLSRIDDYDLATWNQVIQVNLTAPFLITRACLPLLRKADDASVLFTSDTVGRQGKAYWGAYGVSKFGLEGLMQILAQETMDSTRIRFNSIDPGPTRSRLRSFAYPGENPDNLPTAEKYMHIYLFLMGPDSAGITGQALNANPAG
jgi:NAD(P)-dependent dehydrogenase (short-subunit alcohol dehydrogenase family)